MTATLSFSFKIRTLKHQIQCCLDAVKKGMRSFVDRLIILEGQLEEMLKQEKKPRSLQTKTGSESHSTGMTATLTKTQERELNKKINFLLSNPIHTSDFSNPLYTVTDYRVYNMIEFQRGFKNHEEAQKYMDENDRFNIPTEMSYKDDSGFGRGKYKYIIREWRPTVYEFKNRGQAYWFLRNNPEIIESYDRNIGF